MSLESIWSWVQTSWDWLRDNQGPLVAIGTVALAVTTWVYVLRTGKLARSAERSASSAERLVKLEVLPIVYTHTGSIIGGKELEIIVKNVGPRAAFNVHAELRLGEEDEEYQTFGAQRMGAILEPGETAKVRQAVSETHLKALTSDPSPVYRMAFFQDSFGGTYKTELAREAALYELVGTGPPVWRRINPPEHLAPEE